MNIYDSNYDSNTIEYGLYVPTKIIPTKIIHQFSIHFLATGYYERKRLEINS